MSSMGVIGTFGSSTFCLLLLADIDCAPHSSPQNSDHRLEGELDETLGLAGVNQASSRDANVESLSARKTIVVGSPLVASNFSPAALRLSLTRSAWCLIVCEGLVERLQPGRRRAGDLRWSTFRTRRSSEAALAVLDRAAPSRRPADEPAGRSYRR